jgi:hypothetical protein
MVILGNEQEKQLQNGYALIVFGYGIMLIKFG